ncbi:MAG: sulfite exporter TauE/SafE family protein [Pelagimonas sp.]
MGLSKGGVPMIALLSVPLLSLYMDPALAAGLLLPIYIVADAYAVYLFRKAFSRRNLMILLPGALVGILVGYSAVSLVPGDAVKLLLVGIGLSYLFTALRQRISKTEVPARPADVPRGIVWGTLAGLTSYISHAGGPPFQAYVLPQKLDKMVYLGTTTIFFSVVNLVKVPPFVLAGQITWDSLGQAVWLAPLALLGAWSGATVSRLMPEKLFFLLVEVALAVVSLKLLYEVVAG